MGPDLRVDWREVCADPNDFEKLVKMLLQRLHPDGEALDGTGGDGGRDFQVRTVAGTESYDAKSFTGRLSARSPNRRSQVERSLASAAARSPLAWHLVVPIDHNDTELAWFDHLRATRFPFLGNWYGKTWLELHLADDPALVRYATQHRLLEYVRQWNLETAALAGGASTLLDRHRALDTLAEEVIPYWKPVVGRAASGQLHASIEAKRDDAAEKEPISLTLGVSIPDTDDLDDLRTPWRHGLEFGTRVSMPGKFITEFTSTGPPGLGLPNGTFPERLELVPIADDDVGSLPHPTIAVHAPGATWPLASVTFSADERTFGLAGARIIAFDSARSS